MRLDGLTVESARDAAGFLARVEHGGLDAILIDITADDGVTEGIVSSLLRANLAVPLIAFTTHDDDVFFYSVDKPAKPSAAGLIAWLASVLERAPR